MICGVLRRKELFKFSTTPDKIWVLFFYLLMQRSWRNINKWKLSYFINFISKLAFILTYLNFIEKCLENKAQQTEVQLIRTSLSITSFESSRRWEMKWSWRLFRFVFLPSCLFWEKCTWGMLKENISDYPQHIFIFSHSHFDIKERRWGWEVDGF